MSAHTLAPVKNPNITDPTANSGPPNLSSNPSKIAPAPQLRQNGMRGAAKLDNILKIQIDYHEHGPGAKYSAQFAEHDLELKIMEHEGRNGSFEARLLKRKMVGVANNKAAPMFQNGERDSRDILVQTDNRMADSAQRPRQPSGSAAEVKYSPHPAPP